MLKGIFKYYDKTVIVERENGFTTATIVDKKGNGYGISGKDHMTVIKQIDSKLKRL